MFRPSFVTPYPIEASPFMLPAVLGGIAASAYLARAGGLRYGIPDADGNVPLLKDFRAMAVLGAVGANLLPTAGNILLPIVGDLPIVGALVRTVAFGIPDGLQDHINLLAVTAAASLVATEAIVAQETGEFFTFALPDAPEWLLPSPATAAPEEIADTAEIIDPAAY